jgi:GST-like protein
MASWKPPPKVEELFSRTDGNKFSGMNRPTAGARTDTPAQVGSAAFQLYSLATPNGQKIGILLEELGIDYDAWVVNIGAGDQFTKGFVDVNPNSKIPCGVDHKVRLFSFYIDSSSPSSSFSFLFFVSSFSETCASNTLSPAS